MTPRIASPAFLALGTICLLGCNSGNSNDTIPQTGKAPDMQRIGNVVIIEQPKTGAPQGYPMPKAGQAGAGQAENAGQANAPGTTSGAKLTLTEARRGFVTKPIPRLGRADPPSAPPPNVFRLVEYTSPAGEMASYLSTDPGDGKKHPAIVWITGGDCNSVDEIWQEGPRDNEQTAAGYRKAGIIEMFPSLRGGNGNPGQREGFFGEVDDVLAAADYLSHQDYVNPQRIYLGGHSTGGTLVMLVAESTDRFRAVFSFGPVDDVRGYPPQFQPFDTQNAKEVQLRSPGYWLDSVRSPLYVFEGTVEGNMASVQKMSSDSKNPLIHFHPVEGFTHFSILAPANELIAAKILKDEGPTTNISFSEEELSNLKNQPAPPPRRAQNRPMPRPVPGRDRTRPRLPKRPRR